MGQTMTKERWLGELCGGCDIRNPGTAYCWVREMLMPADCPACRDWVSDDE